MMSFHDNQLISVTSRGCITSVSSNTDVAYSSLPDTADEANSQHAFVQHKDSVPFFAPTFRFRHWHTDVH